MIARPLIWLGMLATTVASLQAAWTPPANPVPTKIYQEAQADLLAQRYEDALAKHVWYHENALKIEPAQAGVRLSFALNSWSQLGKAYPPALTKLKSIQDGLEQQIAKGAGTFESFHDFVSINRVLNEVKRTKDSFVLLDSKASPLAQRVFDIAMPSLIVSQEYTLCGRYIQADTFYKKAADGFRFHTKYEIENPNAGPKNSSFAKQSFSNKCTTLVALLVKNDRLDEAKKVAADAAKEFDDADFKAKLEKALKGEVPPPWP